MPVPAIPGLSALPDYVLSDPGLAANIPLTDIEGGAAAAVLMNTVFARAITVTGVNTDGILTPEDVRAMSDHIRANPALYAQFIEGHGNDEGNMETGYHLVQGDGGAYQFQGRNFINTVGDAIYHIGFANDGERFVNEDGDQNERVDDVAGWLNYFVNGENRVYGTNGSDALNSGAYSFALAAAADEIFNAWGGNDTIWAGSGHDTVFAGNGHDRAGGGAGNDLLYGGIGSDSLGGDEGNDRLLGEGGDDRMWGDEGNDLLVGGAGSDHLHGGAGNDRLAGGTQDDTLYGGEGDDSMWGQNGNDRMGGGLGNDRLLGEAGNDSIYGDEGSDVLFGGAGNDHMGGGAQTDWLYGGAGEDTLSGGTGHDRLMGQSGNDSLRGGEGRDRIIGGAGVDEMSDWEDTDVRDVFVFSPGETGIGAGNRDIIRGFDSGIDQIDLRGFGDLSLGFGATFSADGTGEIIFDTHILRIDVNGDGAVDAEIELSYVNALSLSDFILA